MFYIATGRIQCFFFFMKVFYHMDSQYCNQRKKQSGSITTHIILFLKTNKIFNSQGLHVLLGTLLRFPIQQGTFATEPCCVTTGNPDRFMSFSSLTKHPLNPLLLRSSKMDLFIYFILPHPEATSFEASWKCAVSTLIFQQPFIFPRFFFSNVSFLVGNMLITSAMISDFL